MQSIIAHSDNRSDLDKKEQLDGILRKQKEQQDLQEHQRKFNEKGVNKLAVGISYVISEPIPPPRAPDEVPNVVIEPKKINKEIWRPQESEEFKKRQERQEFHRQNLLKLASTKKG